MVRRSVTQDGTDTVYRDRLALNLDLAHGLTRRQADAFARLITVKYA